MMKSLGLMRWRNLPAENLLSTIDGLDEGDRAYHFNGEYRAPFDACILVRM